MKKLLLLAATGILLAGCTSASQTTGVPMEPDTTDTTQQTQSASPTTQVMVQPTVVQLAALKNSGQTGTATFSDLGEGRTKVTLSLVGGNFTAAQPAHIHVGTCTKPGDVKYPLTNVVNGMSETTLDVPMSALWTGGMIVNVHKSEKEANVYTTCGELGATDTSSSPGMMPTNASATPMSSGAPTMPQNY